MQFAFISIFALVDWNSHRDFFGVKGLSFSFVPFFKKDKILVSTAVMPEMIFGLFGSVPATAYLSNLIVFDFIIVSGLN